jgi:hypothetical protein
MPYIVFYGLLPQAAGFPPASQDVPPASARAENPAEYSETGNGDDVTISLSLSAPPGPRGLGGTAESAQVSITRVVKTHTNGAARQSRNVTVGDLPFYRIALLSTDPGWKTDLDREQWPKAYLELDTQAGPRLKYYLERLVIDNWSLDASEGGQITETIQFRGWVIRQQTPGGNQVQIALGNSGRNG